MTNLNATAAANRRGIAYMSGAMVCFVANDMLIKKLGESLPLPQLIFVRQVLMAIFILVLIRATVGVRHVASLGDRRVVGRSIFDALGSLMYLAALMHLPLANATAINLASPLVIAAMASIFLGDSTTLNRWVLIAVGFIGVLMIVQPTGSGFSNWAWVCAAGTLFQSIRDLITRSIHRDIPALAICLGNAIFVGLAAGAWASASGWQSMTPLQAIIVLIAAVFLTAGYLFIVQSLRTGVMSVVSPFRYVGLLMALLLGWVVWGDVPNPLATAGILVLAVAGVRLLHEQRNRAPM